MYDSLYQLTEAIYPHEKEQYTYDKAGNRLTLTTEKRKEKYCYDNAGRLTARSVYSMPKGSEQPPSTKDMMQERTYRYCYDKQGNILSDGENTYHYDSGNRLSEITTKEGNIQKNRYDGEGLRAELEENGKLVQFLYDGDKVIGETDTENNTIRYIRGYTLISSDSEKARLYYHYVSDELGSITQVTNECGEVLNRYSYNAFGNYVTKEETVFNRFGFTGEIHDRLTGQYYLRARFYNPVVGRFLNEDTYYGDGVNLYLYCHNNPVGYVDPSGHASYQYQYIPDLFDDLTGLKPSDSENLGKNMFEHLGIDVNTTGTGSHQKQHLIPQEVYKKSKFLQNIGFNVDYHQNGIFDKNKNNSSKAVNQIFKDNNISKGLTNRYLSDKTHHGGGHGYYNRAVESEIRNIEKAVKRYEQKLIRDGLNPEQAKTLVKKEARKQVHIFVEDLRTMNINGIDLYSGHKSNSKKYKNQREYNKEFNKKKQEAHKQNWHKKYK